MTEKTCEKEFVMLFNAKEIATLGIAVVEIVGGVALYKYVKDFVEGKAEKEFGTSDPIEVKAIVDAQNKNQN